MCGLLRIDEARHNKQEAVATCSTKYSDNQKNGKGEIVAGQARSIQHSKKTCSLRAIYQPEARLNGFFFSSHASTDVLSLYRHEPYRCRCISSIICLAR